LTEHKNKEIMDNIPSKKGNYILVFYLEKKIEHYRFRLKDFSLPPGYYFYCGSAHGSGGLGGRIARHRSRSSKKFWHIDFIKEYFRPLEYWYQVSSKKHECALCQFMENRMGGKIKIKDFGSSDCRNKCKSHLLWFQQTKKLNSMFNELNREFGGFSRIHEDALL